MPTVTLDFRKAPPATGGGRQDYIKPGTYRMKVVKYDDKDSKGGKTMYAFTMQVSRGEERGKKITEYFPMPKTAKESLFPVQKLHAFMIAAGAKPPSDKPFKIDLAKFVGKELAVDIGDERQESNTNADGQTFAARTVSRIFDYIDPREAAKGRADDDDDEEDEEDFDDEDDELDDDDEDSLDAEEEDDEDDFPFDDDEEEEEPEPAPRRRGRPAAAATATQERPRPSRVARGNSGKNGGTAATRRTSRQ